MYALGVVKSAGGHPDCRTGWLLAGWLAGWVAGVSGASRPLGISLLSPLSSPLSPLSLTPSHGANWCPMNAEERFLFDLCGYIVVRDVLSPATVGAANAAVDAHYRDAVAAQHMKGREQVARPDTARWDLRGMLGWTDRAPFVEMLAHPKLVRFINEICGRGFRMDHAPTLITQTQGSGADGSDVGLHGGTQGRFNPASYYVWRNGRMHNGLIVVSFQLSDCPPGCGGLAVVAGSHKGNVPWPEGAPRNPATCPENLREFVTQVSCKAGDAVIFTEATMHSTLPWSAAHQRRSVLFRYSPANSAFGGGRHAFDSEHRVGDTWPASWYRGLTDPQRAVLEPPYVTGLERPTLDDRGDLTDEAKRLLQEYGWEGIGRNPRQVSPKL